ncbi:MAG: hypothetical protein K2M20_11815 [Lachnospiraceae bacterium]|nr:hypothetical protein [Lachnospiraceae bacterium]
MEDKGYMMGFEEFTENILIEIRARADGVFQVKKHDAAKNNNVKLTGITVMKKEADTGFCVYLDGLYREYESGGMEFGEIVDEVYRLIQQHGEDAPDVDISGLRNWETVYGDIRAKLINAEQNKEQLKEIPHRRFLDLAVVYYAVVKDHAQEEIGTVLIRNGQMEKWGQEEETLYQTAMRNMRADGEADFATIETVIRNIMPGITFPAGRGRAPWATGMYILTNRRKRFGAAEILDRKTLRMIADRIGDKFIVLPSSLHETIVLPPGDETEYQRLANMVREVNDTQVDLEERLSYHVYVYSRDEGTLKTVA